MQKVTEFLEKNVEWVAIGLGAIFLLWMTWGYVLSPVAKVSIGDAELGPSEIDVYTHEHVGKPLESAIQDSTNSRLPSTVPSYTKAFNDMMTWSTAPALATDAMWPNLTKDPELPPTTVVDPRNPQPGVVPNPGGVAPAPAPQLPPGKDQKVAALPVPPVASPAESKFGRSVVLKPGPDGVVPPAPAPGQPVIGGVDVDWVTQMFKISMADLDKEFRAKKIPLPPPGAEAFKTTFLQIEMQREELDENGQPVPNTLETVPAIPVYRNAGQPIPPFPVGNPGKAVESTYLSWAMQNSGDVLQPLFYTVGRGDPWTKPGAQPVAMIVFDPATFVGDVNTLPTDQKKAVMDYRREQQRLKNEQQKQSRPTRTPAPGRSGPPEVEGRGVNYAVAPPPARPPVRQPPYRANPNLPPEMDGGIGYGGEGGYGGGGATPPSMPQPGVDYPGNGQEFDPHDPLWNAKIIECWMHDETAKAEKTYHYRLKYKIKNPIWAAGNVALDPKLADQFALESDWSAWSSPVTIPALVNFFVQSLPPGANVTSCKFEIFKWENGEPKSEIFTAGFGDQVGSVSKTSGIDYSTGWTIVDFRDDPRAAKQILLINSKNRVITRSADADRNDPLYKGLKEQIAALKATETAAAPGGAPIGISGGK